MRTSLVLGSIVAALALTLTTVFSPLLIAHAGGGDSYFFSVGRASYGWNLPFMSNISKPATAHFFVAYPTRVGEVKTVEVPSGNHRQEVLTSDEPFYSLQTVIPEYGIAVTTVWSSDCGQVPQVRLEKNILGFKITWAHDGALVSSSDLGRTWDPFRFAYGYGSSLNKQGVFSIAKQTTRGPDALDPCGSVTWIVSQ